MFKNTTLLDIISAAIKAFEKDLLKFNFRKIVSKQELKDINNLDRSMVLSMLSNSLYTFVNSIPKVNIYDLTKCYRFTSTVHEKDNHQVITVCALKYSNQDCTDFDAFSLIFTTHINEIESFKFELSRQETNKEQKLNYRLIVRNNGEISVEFFNNPDSKAVQTVDLLETMSKVTDFDFSKQIVFALGGTLTHIKML